MSFIIAFLISLQLFAAFWLAVSNRSLEKLFPYECGLEPIGDARMKFSILYYLIGILYLIFDLEIILLFPLASILFSLTNLLSFIFAMLFLIIQTIGFIYEYNQGALDIL